MPKPPFGKMPAEEPAQRLAALRRARYGFLLALHSLLWCAVGRTSTAIAAGLLCARFSVYRPGHASRTGTLGLEPDAAG